MKVFDSERQEWAGSPHERVFPVDQYLDVRRQRDIRLRAAAVLAAAGLCFGVWALGWKDEPEPYREPATSGQDASADGGGGEAATPGGTPSGDASDDMSDGADEDTSGESAAALPDGYHEYQDPEGFRIALPDGWERDSLKSQYGIRVVSYRDPGGIRRLQVFQLMETSPYASLQAAQKEAKRLDGYAMISLQEVPGDPGQAAEHEYRADEVAGEQNAGTTRHVIDHRFEAADGERYALVAYGADDDGGDDERELVDTAALWFCPPGSTCQAPAAG
ncbi:hypothetical protein ACFY93_16060 [Streptomyces sp. NPDC008313]|uniref:hypothetical protein n=1 Tax=Streptomyces sp. NPDC008313 TaxID=3364826 RepID=UPI0036EF6B01